MTKDIALKAACADTFYYPPEWRPERGSLDHFQRKRGFEHHFGKSRTKNLHKGVLVIRFEMPFKVQCLRCQEYINQGTRYDADKKKVGNYLSSPIYEFSMRCGTITTPEKSADGKVHCNQHFVIRTDPQNDDYALVEGLRRKAETWDPKDAETIELADPETRRQMNLDPMFKVEKTVRDKNAEKTAKQRLAALEDLQAEREDSYSLNCAMRRRNRTLRKEEQAKEEARRRAGPLNFALPLLPIASEDGDIAKTVNFRTDHHKVDFSVRRARARAAPLFGESLGDSSSSICISTSSDKKKGGSSTSTCASSSDKKQGLPASSTVVAKRALSQLSDGHLSTKSTLSTESSSTVRSYAELAAKRRRLEQHAKMAKLFS